MTKKEKLVEALKEQNLWKNKLKEDCVSQKVFLAIRDSKIDFYHKGGRLFSFDGKDFRTHVKYAAVIDPRGEKELDYLAAKDLSEYKLISDFEVQYTRIKENCSKYSGVEALGVSEVYHRHSYWSESDVVVLDIEASFKSFDEEMKQDRIDILLLDTGSGNLQFVEAKHYSNNDLWSTGIPAVVGQIEKYETQVKERENEMLERWAENVKLLNKLFGKSLPEPNKIDPEVTLFVFGFDEDQKRGRLATQIKKSEKFKGLKFYSAGNPSLKKSRALWDAKILASC